MHPEDLEMVQRNPRRFANRYVDWNLIEAVEHAATLPDRGVLHVGLHPQPFVGNIVTPLIYILHGNPGFAPHDYHDELANNEHAAACECNLRNADRGFFPLGEASAGTGAAKYWQNALAKAISDLAGLRDISISAARNLFQQYVCVIESCAYHSAGVPGTWVDTLPSSQVARRYAQDVAISRARRGDSLVFIWRRLKYWAIGEGHGNIVVRHPNAAQNRHIFLPERTAIVNFIHARAG
jgi:hypothetical protein